MYIKYIVVTSPQTCGLSSVVGGSCLVRLGGDNDSDSDNVLLGARIVQPENVQGLGFS